MIDARRLSDLNEKQWQSQRRQRKLEAQQRVQQGAELAKQRDDKKRTYDQMSSDEQQILKDFDTQKSNKQYKQTSVQKPQFLRGEMLSTVTEYYLHSKML